jgi:hypothetical protein
MDLVEIDCKKIYGNFLDLMDVKGGQLARTASALFDQDGHFRRLLTHYHPPKDRLDAVYTRLVKENSFHRGTDYWRENYRPDSRLLLLSCLNFDVNVSSFSLLWSRPGLMLSSRTQSRRKITLPRHLKACVHLSLFDRQRGGKHRR